MQLSLRYGVALLLASSLAAQNLVPIPPHTVTYNGFSRGYNFTSNTTFLITALDLPVDAFQVGDTASYLVIINGTQALHSIGNAGQIATNILVTNGDVVDIIGNWSPAVPGNFTAHNSYGGPAPYATTIEGVAHTLNRVGWQWDVGDPAFAGAAIGIAAGNMGRIEMYTATPSGTATKFQYGAGCYDDPRMVFEDFPASPVLPNDLDNTQWTMIFGGDTYIILPGGPGLDLATAAANGTDLALGAFTSSSSASWDDASVTQSLTSPIPYPGGSTNDITINSNAKFFFGATVDTTFATNGSNHGNFAPFQGLTGSGLATLSAFGNDLDPTTGGSIYYEDPSPTGGVRITWTGISNWQDTAAGAPLAVANDIQVEIDPGGSITIAFGSIGNGGSASNNAIVGFSAGGGQPASTPVDWSTLVGYETGTGAVPLLFDSDARPVMGTTINLIVDQIPAGSLVAGVILSETKFDPGFDLTPFGLPGCELYVGLDFFFTTVLPGAQYSLPLTIPANNALIGYNLNGQGFVLNPVIPNPFQGITSNGLEMNLDVN